MKASELIKALKSEIETYGDLEVRNIDGIPFLYVEECLEKGEDGKVAAEWFEVV